MKKTVTAFVSICALLLFLVGAGAGESFYLGQGTRGTLVKTSGAPLSVGPNHPPLEGPLARIAFTLTDKGGLDEFDFFVSAEYVLAGSPLPAALTNVAIGVLDSGAATTIISYPDSVDLGMSGSFVTDSTLPLGGIGGQIEVDVSIPVGVFAHGVQDLGPGGAISNALLMGQGNFPCGVNTEYNYNNGSTLPTVIGAPFLTQFPVGVRNSQRMDILYRGETLSTPSVTVYTGPSDPALPTYSHQVFLELIPTGLGIPQFLAFPNFIDGGYDFILPALIDNAGSLFRTSSPLTTVSKGGVSRPVKLMVDTAAQATIISASVAADLGLNLVNPPFEIELQGFSGATETVPGAYLDELYLPAAGGALVWSNVPVVVKSTTGPDGAVMDGIFGSNLLGNRDFVFNGVGNPDRFLDISDVVAFPDPEITAIRRQTNDTVEVDWLSHPAPPMMCMEATTNILDMPPSWSVVATGELATITGTMSVTGAPEHAIFRLVAP